MSVKRKRVANPLANRQADISITRGGLVIEVKGVAASDSERVAAILLDSIRRLIATGYDELVEQVASNHSGAFGEMPDEDGIETALEPTVCRRPTMGFRP